MIHFVICRLDVCGNRTGDNNKNRNRNDNIKARPCRLSSAIINHTTLLSSLHVFNNVLLDYRFFLIETNKFE